jgi:hypothetical protein
MNISQRAAVTRLRTFFSRYQTIDSLINRAILGGLGMLNMLTSNTATVITLSCGTAYARAPTVAGHHLLQLHPLHYFNADSRQREQVLIHEASHHALNSRDGGYGMDDALRWGLSGQGYQNADNWAYVFGFDRFD